MAVRYYRKTRKKPKRRKPTAGFPIAPILTVSILLASSLWLAFVQWFAASKGLLGTLVSETLKHTFGFGALFIPLLFFYGLFVFIKKTEKKYLGLVSFLTGAVFSILGISSVVSASAKMLGLNSLSGGISGNFLSAIVESFAGVFGAFVFSFLTLWIGLHILFGISFSATLKKIFVILYNDYTEWSKAGKILKSKVKQADEVEKQISRAAPVIKRAGMVVSETKKEQIKTPIIKRAKTAVLQKNILSKNENRPDNKDFKLPPLDLFTSPPAGRTLGPTDTEIAKATAKLEGTLSSFEIQAHVTGAIAGPVVTRYELTPNPGVRVSSIVSLSNDIALAMKARGIRVEAPIPGKDAIGFEIPNDNPVMVYLREILEDEKLKKHKSLLSFALGRYADGSIAYADLEKMPHILVAGATNSGKSICLHTIIASILTRAKPDDVKFLLIDPKRLELTFYENIPHLYDPKVDPDEVSVVTSPKGAVKSLKALVKVMEGRYKTFEMAKVKNIESYNKWAAKNDAAKCFYIVVIIDELADLMLQTKAAVEDSIQRLAQMARAVGIHLVLCTQRPSVNVITGVIKANLPSRIALQVTSKTDSRVILDTPGAETLLGKGDMLYLAIDAQKPSRIQGAYLSEEEITSLADFLKTQGRPDYPCIFDSEENDAIPSNLGVGVDEFKSALKLITQRRRVSQDLLKAHFGSSARATNILSVLEIQGFISKPEGSNRWDIQFDKIEHQLNSFERTQNFQTTVKNGI